MCDTHASLRAHRLLCGVQHARAQHVNASWTTHTTGANVDGNYWQDLNGQKGGGNNDFGKREREKGIAPPCSRSWLSAWWVAWPACARARTGRAQGSTRRTRRLPSSFPFSRPLTPRPRPPRKAARVACRSGFQSVGNEVEDQRRRNGRRGNREKRRNNKRKRMPRRRQLEPQRQQGTSGRGR